MALPRWRASRIVSYLLLQALIAALCVFGLMQSLPQPPAQYRITEFKTTEGDAELAVTLPHFTATRHAADDSRAARCGIELGLNSAASGTRVRLQLPPRFPDSDAATV